MTNNRELSEYFEKTKLYIKNKGDGELTFEDYQKKQANLLQHKVFSDGQSLVKILLILTGIIYKYRVIENLINKHHY